MNRKEYLGDPRYAKVLEQMDLLGIMDISTTKQSENGTIVWKLPIKNEWPGNRKNATFIEVASFRTGYVRNQNSGYSNYQLNKRCESEPEYFDSGKKDSMDRPLYTQWTTRTCKLIPIEIDRLEYLISYCLKNYYIKRANQVADGEFVPQWEFDNACKNGHDMLHEQKQYENQRVRGLENKLDTIKRIADYEEDN